MKTMKKRTLAALLILVMVLSLMPLSAFAAADPRLVTEYIPNGKLTAPKTPYVVYEYNEGYGDFLYLWYNNGPEVLAVTKAYNTWNDSEEDTQDKFRELFGVESFEFVLETDCRIDGGAWQYTRDWDDPAVEYVDDLENMPSYLVFTPSFRLTGSKVYADETLSWLTYIDGENEEETAGFLLPSLYTKVNEYGDDIYHFDMENHTYGFRCRTKLAYWGEDGERRILFSDWSPETSIGKNGTQRTLSAPTSIPAPSLDSFELRVETNDEGKQWADAWYFLNIPEAVYDGLLYCEAQEDMFEPYYIQAQIRVNGGEWEDSYTANPVWIFSDNRATAPDNGYLQETDQVEIRVRLECEELGLVSDWSNVVGNKPEFTAHNWAKAELEEADKLGLIPDCLKGADLTQPITRAEFAAVSVKLFEAMSFTKASPAPADTFSDTSDPEVLKAFALGVTNGTDSVKKLFSPDTFISREQTATMLTRVYKKLNLSGWTLETDSSFGDAFRALFTRPEPFADDGEISSWAKDSVYFMAANGIVNGVGDNRFAPKLVQSGEETLNHATREQALLMSVRTVNNLG